MSKATISDFEHFLRSKSLIKEKYIRYYAHWARKFLIFLNTVEPANQDLCAGKYIKDFSTQSNITDWQIRQADDAVRLFIYNFHGGNLADSHPNVQQSLKKHLSLPDILKETQKAIRLKHYSISTERTYMQWIKRFYGYVNSTTRNNNPDSDCSANDVRNYLSFLALKKRVSASTQNQAFNSLLFLFRNVLHRELGDLSKTVRAKRGQRLPTVLSIEEIKAVFNNVKGVNGLVLQLLYGGGLRLMEALRLRIKDIDFNSNLLFIRNGKGDKDRSTVLPESVKKELKVQLEEVKKLHAKDLESSLGAVYLPNALERKYPGASKEWCWQYAFPSSNLSSEPRTGKVGRHHIHERTIQSALKSAVKKASIPKHVSVHTLRHSFATHLLMSGVNIREIQQLLGHKNVETTMIYTHVIRDLSKAPLSPLDNL